MYYLWFYFFLLCFLHYHLQYLAFGDPFSPFLEGIFNGEIKILLI